MYCGSFHGFVGNCSYLMVTGPNEHIAFPNPESKSSPQAATEPGRRLWSRRFKTSQTHLYQQAGLSGLFTVPQQCVCAPARKVVVEAVEGLKVVLTPRPAGHLPLKAKILNCACGKGQRLQSRIIKLTQDTSILSRSLTCRCNLRIV